MGCASSTKKDPERKQNQVIDYKLRQVETELSNNLNLLLMGPGDSGKSTIAKQMKIIHSNGFRKKEKIKFKIVIYQNILDNLQILIQMIKTLNLDELPTELERIAQEITHLDDEIPLNEEIGEKISQLWDNPSLKKAFDNRAKFHIPDTIGYFLDKISEISSPDYIPSQEDILRCRLRTTGIIQTSFTISGQKFTIIDVGGQRNERRKWINCFENITAVLFIASLSEFNQQLFEDERMNRMHESLLLFEEITNSRWFTESSIILFLNKVDIFKEKISKFKLQKCFPKYNGKNNFDDTSNYIKQQFLKKVENKKPIYTHFTCATDTTNIRFVFEAVKDIILQNITEFGIF
ncbi:guanine nucleotide-binding protein g(o) subunit alpha [Anaeramoeba flamelloides]|uniref:Guanine nucleotide-binding protein g(O) subunit alpha n=1 Tax=Anaeramoeba flamelloides TaxID=1746091 RepID=A0AAV7ZLM7_9EUKA|nr:guanine nucleotide-binding protein g(o) subunit alpha [Anaeramoeba flamelloides]